MNGSKICHNLEMTYTLKLIFEWMLGSKRVRLKNPLKINIYSTGFQVPPRAWYIYMTQKVHKRVRLKNPLKINVDKSTGFQVPEGVVYVHDTKGAPKGPTKESVPG